MKFDNFASEYRGKCGELLIECGVPLMDSVLMYNTRIEMFGGEIASLIDNAFVEKAATKVCEESTENDKADHQTSITKI